jgi:hypothetical protein
VLCIHNLFTCKRMFLMQDKCACRCQVQLQMFCAIWWQACMFDVKLSRQVLMQQEKLFLLFPCALWQQSGLRWPRCPPLDQVNALANQLEGFMFSFYLCFHFIAYLIKICFLLVFPFNCGVPLFLWQISLASFEFHHWSTKGHCNWRVKQFASDGPHPSPLKHLMLNV